jgi:hypothetical protein
MKHTERPILLALVLTLLCGVAAGSTEPSPFINYEGVLRDSAGNPLTGDYDMELVLYDAETGGNVLLTDSHTGTQSVGVSSGLFNTALGGGTLTPDLYSTLPDVFAGESAVWLEVRIFNSSTPGWETLSPRTRVLSAASALNAGHLGGNDAAFFLDTSAGTQTKSGDLGVDDLTVSGQVTVAGGSPADGKVLTSDATGLATWEDPLPGPAGPEGPEGPEGPPGPSGVTGKPVHSVTVVDSTDDVGIHAAMAIGDDGLPVIAYVDRTGGRLKVAHCTDVSCTAATITDTGLSARVDGRDIISVTIGPDGYPVISHRDTNVVHCGDADCSTVSENFIGGIGFSSIAIGRTGLPLVSLIDSGNLALAYCSDAACSSFSSMATIDDSDGYTYSSLSIAPDGYPIFSYAEDGSDTYRHARCQDYGCTSVLSGPIFNDSSGSGVAERISMTLGHDGLPIIAYYHATTRDLSVTHCDDLACTSSTGTTLDSTGDVGRYASITVAPDGLPIISYYDETNGDLKVAKCTDAECTSASKYVVDDTGNVGQYSSIAIGTDGMPIIAYYDATSEDLKVVHCSNRYCVPFYRPR